MPILDHIEKIVAPNSNGVTIPYAFNPGALNRYVLVLAMVSTPTNISTSLPDNVTYAGLTFDNARTGRSIGEGAGSPTTWCRAYARSLSLGAQPLSGDVVVNLSFQSNLIVYVIGFRGVGSFPYVWEREGVDSVPQANISAVMNNPYIGVAGFAIKDEAFITSVSGAAEVAEQETIADDLLSLTGSVVLVPQGQSVTTGFLNGNAGWGSVEWVPLADMDQGEDHAAHVVRLVGSVGPAGVEGSVAAATAAGGSVGPAPISGVLEDAALSSAVATGARGLIEASELAASPGANQARGVLVERVGLGSAAPVVATSGTLVSPKRAGIVGLNKVTGTVRDLPG